MNWRDIIDLVSIVYTENELGDIIQTKENRMVYANKKSIRQSEFYQAQATGLRPELSFEIRSVEYNEEEELEYAGEEYNVIRTFDKGEFIELICQGVVNNANA